MRLSLLLLALAACGAPRVHPTAAALDCEQAVSGLGTECRDGLRAACDRQAASGYIVPPLACLAGAKDCSSALACSPSAVPGGVGGEP